MGDTDEGLPELRVGDAERHAAMRALDDHLEAGRLSVDEYADRSAAAVVAVRASDLTVLFADLPAPHPTMPRRPGDVAPVRPSPSEVYARPAGAGPVVDRESDAAVPVALGLLLMLAVALPALAVLGAATGGAVGGVVLFLPLLFLLASATGRGRRRGPDC